MRRHSGVLGAALCLAAGLGGCIFPPAGSDGGGGDAGTQYGFGKPTLEVTISGVHFGPSAPDPGSRADLVTNRDSFTGRASDTTLRVSASSSASGASCAIAVHRAGDDVAPLGPGGYQVVGGSLGATPDGAVAVVGGAAVAVPQGTWQCSGTQCGGGVLVITALDAAHAEGYLADTFASAADGSYARVVCSFYVPTGTFAP